MTSHEYHPIRKYLDQLEVELKRRGVKPDEALSDAHEFLQCELDRQQGISSRDLYAHFVQIFGSPDQVADAYSERPIRARQTAIRSARKPRCMSIYAAAASFIVVSTVGLCMASLMQRPPKLSPFTEVRYEADKAIVTVRGKQYELVALDGIPVEKIFRTAQDHFGERWQKRFAEDLVEVLWHMDHRPKATVKLELRDPSSGKLETIPDAAMTEANRGQVWEARNKINQPVYEQFTNERTAVLFAEFKAILHDRWSYYPYSATEIDQALDELDKALADLGKRAPNAMNSPSLARRFQVVIAHGIDGHAEVSGRGVEGYYLPFLIEAAGDRFIAFYPDRRKFLDDGFPYITAIDGRPIADWIEAAKMLIPKGSPAYVTRHALRQIRGVEARRREMGLVTAAPLQIQLEAGNGQKKYIEDMELATRQPTYGVWPSTESRKLDGNIGYLRLASMDDEALVEIKQRMGEFKDTVGLIVDVRDNGGGSREPLRLIASYAMSESAAPRVVNCAKYRLYRGFGPDQLESRFMYREDAKKWTDAERAAIAMFRQSFKPEWNPPENQFSDWHYMVLSRLRDPSIYHYSKPVVVLMNGKCFSATDVFLAALKGMPNVKLMGTASSGGSARAETVRLSGSPIQVRLGSMVSYMPGGQLFDTHGVQPDQTIEPTPDYFIGKADNVLAEAIAHIRRK